MISLSNIILDVLDLCPTDKIKDITEILEGITGEFDTDIKINKEFLKKLYNEGTQRKFKLKAGELYDEQQYNEEQSKEEHSSTDTGYNNSYNDDSYDNFDKEYARNCVYDYYKPNSIKNVNKTIRQDTNNYDYDYDSESIKASSLSSYSKKYVDSTKLTGGNFIFNNDVKTPSYNLYPYVLNIIS
jgi:vesicle coat complex subunit